MALLGAWACNEGTGTTSADASGNGNNLALGTGNGMGWGSGTGSEETNALSCVAGTVTGATATSSGLGGSTAITLMGWVNPTDLAAGQNRPFFGLYGAAVSTEFAFWGERTIGPANVSQIELRTTGLNELGGPALTVGTFVHVAATYDGAHLLYYVNGTQVASAAITGGLTTPTLLIVGGVTGNSASANCLVNDIRLYSQVLTQSQIALCMGIAVTSEPDPLNPPPPASAGGLLLAAFP
jgi:hypothetical protein